MTAPKSYTRDDYTTYCDSLAARDDRLARIIAAHGHPEFWHREPGFACLVRIILEQQVSLASAYAAFEKLEKLVGEITPKNVLGLSDEDLKGCGFSRQKTVYVRELSGAVQSGQLDVDGLVHEPDETVREQLIVIKGIGEWTVNVYLLLSLHRLDVFPAGDLALVKSMVSNGFVEKGASREDVMKAAQPYAPLRSIFALLLWHSYISENNVMVP